MTETARYEDVVDGLKLFWGDGREYAQLWKKRFSLVMLGRTMTIAQGKCDRLGAALFEGYMRPGETGEEWLILLTQQHQESWQHINTLFDIRWPQEPRRVESYVER